jgi:hypothetical protein
MSLRSWLERLLLAITFAEADDHETARKFLKKERKQKEVKRVRQRPRLRLPNRGDNYDR